MQNKKTICIIGAGFVFLYCTIYLMVLDGAPGFLPKLLLSGWGFQCEAPIESHILDKKDNYETLCDRSPFEVNPKPRSLVLFTTLADTLDKRYIHFNTIRNWGMLHNSVQPVLFLCKGKSKLWDANAELIKEACKNGWDVLQAPSCNHLGIPILKTMYEYVFKHFNSFWYGYANGDILFTADLPSTLNLLQSHMDLFSTNLVVGRRTGVKLKPNETFYDPKLFNQRAKDEGTMNWVNAIDYFISTRCGYPWSSIPDFVIGRRAYDNWLLWYAYMKDVKMIDITETCLSVHQIGNSNYSSRWSPKDPDINVNLIGPNWDYYKGFTTCSNYLTQFVSPMETLGKGETLPPDPVPKEMCLFKRVQAAICGNPRMKKKEILKLIFREKYVKL